MATTALRQVRLSASRANICNKNVEFISAVKDNLPLIIAAAASFGCLAASILGLDIFMYLCAFIALAAVSSVLNNLPNQQQP